MLKKYLLHFFIFFTIVIANPRPVSPISPNFVQDYVKGGNKSGFIVGGGLGIPSTPTQLLEQHKLEHSSSYGFHALIGYQNFKSQLIPFPPNFFGARILFETYNTLHLSQDGILSSNMLLFSYDILYDFFPKSQQTFGLILGFNIGAVKIQKYQNFSLGLGIKIGFGYAFDENHRLEANYIIAQSGPLKGDRFYFYSPYTINITYTYRFTIPLDKILPKK